MTQLVSAGEERAVSEGIGDRGKKEKEVCEDGRLRGGGLDRGKWEVKLNLVTL